MSLVEHLINYSRIDVSWNGNIGEYVVSLSKGYERETLKGKEAQEYVKDMYLNEINHHIYAKNMVVKYTLGIHENTSIYIPIVNIGMKIESLRLPYAVIEGYRKDFSMPYTWYDRNGGVIRIFNDVSSMFVILEGMKITMEEIYRDVLLEGVEHLEIIENQDNKMNIVSKHVDRCAENICTILSERVEVGVVDDFYLVKTNHNMRDFVNHHVVLSNAFPFKSRLYRVSKNEPQAKHRSAKKVVELFHKEEGKTYYRLERLLFFHHLYDTILNPI